MFAIFYFDCKSYGKCINLENSVCKITFAVCSSGPKDDHGTKFSCLATPIKQWLNIFLYVCDDANVSKL